MFSWRTYRNTKRIHRGLKWQKYFWILWGKKEKRMDGHENWFRKIIKWAYYYFNSQPNKTSIPFSGSHQTSSSHDLLSTLNDISNGMDTVRKPQTFHQRSWLHYECHYLPWLIPIKILLRILFVYNIALDEENAADLSKVLCHPIVSLKPVKNRPKIDPLLNTHILS